MNASQLKSTIALALLALVVSCATRIPFELEQSTAPVDLTRYNAAAVAGAKIYEIVPAESLVLIQVGRTGTMARLGHDHAVASQDLEGLVALNDDFGSSFGTVAMPLKNLIVDKEEYRQKLGLKSTPSETDIAGTYTNMQRVLDADAWPWAIVDVELADTSATPPVANVSISMHGTTQNYEVPVEITVGDLQLSVETRFTVKQSDFGMTPFSALGGLMRVTDELKIQLKLVAQQRTVSL